MDHRDIAKGQIAHIVGNGAQTLFLLDHWHPNEKLIDWIDPDIIAQYIPNENATVSDFIDGNYWSFPAPTSQLTADVFLKIAFVKLSPQHEDIIIWRPNSKGVFAMKDTYKDISTHLVPVFWHSLGWFKLHIPRRSFIAWLALHNRLKTRDRLVKWGITDSNKCVLCDNGRVCCSPLP